MPAALAAALQVGLLVALLAAVHVPFGDYMARVFTTSRHLRVERVVYRLGSIDAEADQRWPVYARSLLAFSFVSILVLYALLRVQGHLPLSLGRSGVPADGAWNTAVSFVTNTNWQWYAGESTMGHLVPMVGLTVQSFVSAAVGLAVAVALVRGFARDRTDRIGSFWVDLVRGTLRVLLPISLVAAVVLLVGGVVQNLAVPHEITTLSGSTQTMVGGPVASQEAIKNLGTNGGGFFAANAAHPFENPDGWTNLFQVFLMLVIPFSLPRTFGQMVGDRRQGVAILAAMGAIWAGAVAVATWAETRGLGTVPQAAGGAMEGKEVRFGPAASALFGVSTTVTSTGANNASYDSFTGLGGGATLFGMMLGEVAPGGVGAGLYGMLVLAVLTVFLAGLMVGRTPEYLGKKIGRREVTLVALTVLTMPALVLVGAAITAGSPALTDASVSDPSVQGSSAHGLSEILYAYTSTANNNGSAFAAFGADTVYQNTALGVAMLLGRFVPMVLVLALAGSLAAQPPQPASRGTLPTHGPVFVGLLVFVTVVVAGLTFFPALALGPVAEALR
ncbi:MAG: potassium-transporting ATPase subunit KdpA [Micrococcales bacterium]|nr:potassium-transporting ATPase subunit KdpA [Micrococcales bacterium]